MSGDVRAFVGLGSNLGDRWAYLSHAVDALVVHDPSLLISPVYETDPVGGPENQGAYLNCVVELRTGLSPHELLHLVHQLEEDAQRVRAVRFGPRTLDADVLLIDGYESDDPVLTVPHPRMYERAFVLAPLEDLDADIVPANWREALFVDGAPSVRKVGELLRSQWS